MAKSKLSENIPDLIDIQCAEGTYDANSYMHGMANGMILIAALVNDETPEFLDAPEIFKDDIQILDKFNKSPIIVTNKDK